MSKPQNFKRVVVENFEAKDRELVGKLAYSLNGFADDVLSALNNNLSIEDNLNIVKKDITITLDKKGAITGGNGIKTNLKRACSGILVIKVINKTAPLVYPSGTPFISFTEPSSGQLVINNITNLTAGNSYSLKIVLF